jgi:DegV family protein with EDD domain
MRIVMDDAGDVPADLAQKYQIEIVPVNIHFGTEEFLSGVNMTHAAFYQKVEQVSDSNFPKTSQPNPYQFVETYRRLLDQGEKEILTITVSEKLSKTYDSAMAAARELDGQGTFHLFDSQSGSAGQGYLAIEAARMAQAGKPIAEIMARLEKMRSEISIAFLINSLEYAVKGGRVSSFRGTMASLLSIKPIMQVKDGLIVEAGKVRTYKKALAYIVEFVKERVGNRPVRLAVIHAGDRHAAEELLEKAKPAFNTTEVIMVDMAIAVAINLGPGALGIVAIPE